VHFFHKKGVYKRLVMRNFPYFNMTKWKVTLPVAEKSGKRKGKAKEVSFEESLGSRAAECSKWIKIEKGKGLVMRAPCKGTSTVNSKYPRTELREMTKDYKRASWETKDEHVLEWVGKISKRPAVKKEVVFGQIHDANDDVMEIKVDELNRLIVFHDSTNYGVLVDEYNGQYVHLRIETYENKILVHCFQDPALKVFRYEKTVIVPTVGNITGCYFKLGCYQQGKEGSAEVVIKSLKRYRSGSFPTYQFNFLEEAGAPSEVGNSTEDDAAAPSEFGSSPEEEEDSDDSGFSEDKPVEYEYHPVFVRIPKRSRD
jgi:hypothetical protein